MMSDQTNPDSICEQLENMNMEEPTAVTPPEATPHGVMNKNFKPMLTNENGLILLSNIDEKLSREDIYNLFKVFGRILFHTVGKVKTRFGIKYDGAVLFDKYLHAAQAMETYDRTTIAGSVLYIDLVTVFSPLSEQASALKAAAILFWYSGDAEIILDDITEDRYKEATYTFCSFVQILIKAKQLAL